MAKAMPSGHATALLHVLAAQVVDASSHFSLAYRLQVHFFCCYVDLLFIRLTSPHNMFRSLSCWRTCWSDSGLGLCCWSWAWTVLPPQGLLRTAAVVWQGMGRRARSAPARSLRIAAGGPAAPCPRSSSTISARAAGDCRTPPRTHAKLWAEGIRGQDRGPVQATPTASLPSRTPAGRAAAASSLHPHQAARCWICSPC